jgi:hypothetical protein
VATGTCFAIQVHSAQADEGANEKGEADTDMRVDSALKGVAFIVSWRQCLSCADFESRLKKRAGDPDDRTHHFIQFLTKKGIMMMNKQ